jgi:hypothetical protein
MTKDQTVMALDLALKSLREDLDGCADHLDVNDEIIKDLLSALEDKLESD